MLLFLHYWEIKPRSRHTKGDKIDLKKEEKRRFRRIELHTPVRYQVRGNTEFDNTVTENISEGGLAFSVLKFIPPATPVMLELSLLCRTLYPIGKISWCQPLPHSDKNRLGIEFIEFDQTEKTFLSDYVNIKTG